MADSTPDPAAAAPDSAAAAPDPAAAAPDPAAAAPDPAAAAPATEQAPADRPAPEQTPVAGKPSPGTPETLDLPSFDEGPGNGEAGPGLSLLNDVDLEVKVELGRTRMYVEDVLQLNRDSVVELDKAAGDHVDIYVNDRHIARGEVLVLDDNFCIRISEIVEPVKGGE